MPSTRPRASFEPIAPNFNLSAIVEKTPNFRYVDRISCDMIEQQGLPAFEKLIELHVIRGGKPLVIDGYEEKLDPWTFTPKWLRDNSGDKVENARVLNAKENLPLTMGHYLKNMGKLTCQFFDKPNAYLDKKRQRVYLKDIDCPPVWIDKLKEHVPAGLFYLNESTGEVSGPGAVPDQNNTVPGRRLGRGIASAGDLMSSLPPDMRAENLMCYIGHEGTYTPAHREMCASLGQNIMVEASNTVSEDGKAEKPGSSIWFMTETKDRHVVSEYWLSVLGHDIEVEDHFAQVVAWRKAPFQVLVVEQRPGDLILIPPLAPHQVWNRGTRTMKVAWNRTTVETLEMAIHEALPRSRIVCRDEQYKNKAIVYYTLQKYSGLLTMAQQQASRLSAEAAQALLYTGKVKQLSKDFKRLFLLFKQILLSEMFNPEDRDNPKSIEYVPFDSNVTCAYCRGNIFNRFLSCNSCKDVLGHNNDQSEGDPYDVCMECYTMGRSCACISNLKWVEQFRWKELATKYETWRKMIIALQGGPNDKTPLSLAEERKKLGKKTLAEVCKDQLKRRPFKDIRKPEEDRKDQDEDEDEEIVVGDDGTVKSIKKKPRKAWLKQSRPCHVCNKRHPVWKMALCTHCDRGWCYGSLFRGWDKMPLQIMEDPDWQCPHCLNICFAGSCRRQGKMEPYEPKGTLLGHDTKKVADARSVEALVDFSVSNVQWLKDDETGDRTESRRIKRSQAEAAQASQNDPTIDDDNDGMNGVDESRVDYERVSADEDAHIDPALTGGSPDAADEATMIRRLQQATDMLPSRAPATITDAPEGYSAVAAAGYHLSAPNIYPPPSDGDQAYAYPGHARGESVTSMEEDFQAPRPFKRVREDDDDADPEDINMQKHPKAKRPRILGAGIKSLDLAEGEIWSKAKNEAQRQFEKEKEKKALEKAKAEGRFIMLQAALRGKKRIVKLKIDGQRLDQLVTQLAQSHRDDVDAEHDVDVSQPMEDDLSDDDVLKSDIKQKKVKDPNQLPRERNGFVITAKSKKALVPVERDDNYTSKPSGREYAKWAAEAGEKRTNRRRKGPVQYEEVDISSDEEDFRDGVVATQNGMSSKAAQRRSLPGYLRDRHGGDEEEYPDALPENFKDSRRGTGARPGPTQRRTSSKPAGKRPITRPSRGALGPGRSAAEDDEDEHEAINAAANGDLMDIENVTTEQTRRHNAEIEEENRRAKLQALQAMDMLDGAAGNPATGKGRTAMYLEKTQVILSEYESESDGVDAIPARR